MSNKLPLAPPPPKDIIRRPEINGCDVKGCVKFIRMTAFCSVPNEWAVLGENVEFNCSSLEDKYEISSKTAGLFGILLETRGEIIIQAPFLN
jgi:hypothetical protein